MKATWLLQEIIPVKHEFDAGQLTGILRRKYGPQSHKEINKKKISNKLNRLHCMHLVDRERVKRQVVTREGKICNRGYKYLYRTNKQGTKYARYISSASIRQSQQMQEESRAKLQRNMLVLTASSTIGQLQMSNTQLQNELKEIRERKILGKSYEEWLSLIPKAFQKINELEKINSLQSEVIKLLEDKNSSDRPYTVKGDQNSSECETSQATPPPELTSGILSSSDAEVPFTMKLDAALNHLNEAKRLFSKKDDLSTTDINELSRIPCNASGEISLTTLLAFASGCIARHKFILKILDEHMGTGSSSA